MVLSCVSKAISTDSVCVHVHVGKHRKPVPTIFRASQPRGRASGSRAYGRHEMQGVILMPSTFNYNTLHFMPFICT